MQTLNQYEAQQDQDGLVSDQAQDQAQELINQVTALLIGDFEAVDAIFGNFDIEVTDTMIDAVWGDAEVVSTASVVDYIEDNQETIEEALMVAIVD